MRGQGSLARRCLRIEYQGLSDPRRRTDTPEVESDHHDGQGPEVSGVNDPPPNHHTGDRTDDQRCVTGGKGEVRLRTAAGQKSNAADPQDSRQQARCFFPERSL